MKRVTVFVIPAMALALLWSVTGYAHHSVAGTYQLDKDMTIQGTITTLIIRNPHSFVTIDAKDSSGKITSWSAEWAGLTLLNNAGITETTLKFGDQITLVGATPRDLTTHKILLREVTRPADGFHWSGNSSDYPPLHQ